ncbi:MAG: fumarylacetoacetate hydrolase family protein [Gammaproteobacteria bacterium]|nr:fumarylacetoacetate hydrolase family protein [Gammaproteobacteria bacterium]MDP2141575.1 fumarylacetoacetate hydrolase family protein [Gammaproteobacteria bacterium]MDP2346669.1 fumarylacetoacetate hydrolase family protein [Gammaproteobacteria bacterium]
MALLFEISVPSVAIRNRPERFPVNRIYCVGRNYAAHAREMGSNPERESPFFFSKPANAVAENNIVMPYPSRTADLHHEVELVVALAGEPLSAKGENLSLAEAATAIFGYTVGIDFTRRDLQAEAKDKARPWDTAKGFDNSAPMSALTPVAEAGDIGEAQITLKVNGVQRQHGAINDLIWSIPELIAELSTFYKLQPGDLIFTGTPAGVAAVVTGDVLVGEVDNLEALSISIGPRA